MKLISVYGRQTRRPWGKVLPPYVQVALLGLKTVNEDSHAAWPQKEEDSQVDSPPQRGMCQTHPTGASGV